MPRRLVPRPLVMMIIFFLAFIGVILAIAQFWLSEDEMEDDITAQYEPLIAKLENGTPVSLIVELNVEYYNDGLLAESAAQSQRDRLRTTREAIVEELAPYRVDVISASDTWVIPFMSIKIYDEAALRRLMVLPYVLQFEEDIPIPGGPFDFPEIEPSPTP